MLRRRFQTAIEWAMPSKRDSMHLIEQLRSMQSHDDTVHFNFTTGGERNSFCKVLWTFLELIKSFDMFGVVPGVTVDAKAI